MSKDYKLDPKLLKLIKKAGEIALSEQTRMEVQKKEDSSIVTNGDLLVSAFLEKELKLLYPDYDIFSEENCKNKPKSNKVIVIDPIDGTESYSRKEDTWAILIGFMVDNEITGGVVSQPSKGLIYYGFKDKGSYLLEGKEIIKLKAKCEASELKAITSPKDKGEIKLFNALGIKDISETYSASLKIMEVSKGNYDIFSNYRRYCSIWDLIAPVAILREAGGDIVFNPKVLFSFENSLVNADFSCFGKRLDGDRILLEMMNEDL